MMREDCLGQNLKPGGAWILTGETIRRIWRKRIVWVKISSLVALGFWQVKQSEEYDERGLFGSKQSEESHLHTSDWLGVPGKDQ